MKTIDEIVSEMRALADDIEAGRAVVGQTVWRNYADMVEKASRREIEMACIKGHIDELVSLGLGVDTRQQMLWSSLSKKQDKTTNEQENRDGSK